MSQLLSTVSFKKLQDIFASFEAQKNSLTNERNKHFLQTSECFLAILAHVVGNIEAVEHYIGEYMLIVALMIDTFETLEYGTCVSEYQQLIHNQFIVKDRTGSWVHDKCDDMSCLLTLCSINGINKVLKNKVSFSFLLGHFFVD